MKNLNSVLRLILNNIKFNLQYIFVSDEQFNKKFYYKKFNKMPDFKNPKTFAEKLLVLKMKYNNPLQNICADKNTVNDYVKDCGYENILKKVYQVCEKPEEIDLNLMPDKFFIQCSHTQGYNYVVDKSDLKKIDKIKKIYKHLLKRKHYKVLRENCYKGIKPCIICSEYLEEQGNKGLTDYKFYCFSGEVKYFMVSYGEFTHDVKNHKFDVDWNSIDRYFKAKPSVSADEIKKPENFDEMLKIAKKLSAPFPHARVDLYNIDGRIVFGEITFYSAGGFVKIESPEMNEKISSWIDLDKYL